MKFHVSRVMDRQKMIRAGAGIAVLFLAGMGLSGCFGPRREKVDISSGLEEPEPEELKGQEPGKQPEPEELKGQEPGKQPEPEELKGQEPGKQPEPSKETAAPPGKPEAEETKAGQETSEAGPEPEGEGKPQVKAAGEYRAGEVVKPEDLGAVGAGAFFCQSGINKEIYERINGKSYKSGCPVALEDLRYLRVLHYDYQGEIRVGELVCNQSVSDDLLSIFRKLYEEEYPIGKMHLVDDYDGDDDRSSSDNNTSCFNYRKVAGKESLSLHAYGVAVDINPVRNPYVVTDGEGNVTYAPANGKDYGDRTKPFPHKIDENDLCYRLFTEAGFTWGGSWVNEPDYMHFSRGSRPET